MSKRREKKIKRMRRLSIWPQIIETFVVELIIIIIGVTVFMVDTLMDLHNVILSEPELCNNIVKKVEKNWDFSEGKLEASTQDFINNILAYNKENLGGVAIIDDEKNILANYGDKLTKDEPILRSFDKEKLYKSGLIFKDTYIQSEDIEGNEYKQNYTHDEETGEDIGLYISFDYDVSKEDMKSFLKILFTLGDFDSKELLDWAIRPVGANTVWVIVKTDIDGLNVCIKKRSIKTVLDLSREMFVILVMVLCFVFIAIYEHYKLIMAIINKHKFQKIIYTDPITGGYNRDYFLFKGKKMIKRRRNYVLVYLRMEKYRNYVIAYGIKETENLMEDFYKKLCALTRKKKELIAHLEKSDFVLLLNFDNRELLDIRMQAITNALNECRPNQHLGFSKGACRILSKNDDVQEKISNAAASISKLGTKASGVAWFDEAMREEQIWERRVEDDMERALAANEFKVYLQPKYSTKKEELSAAEALVRWIHPEYGFVSPGKFIPIFEKNGFIIKLDDFMLTEVAKLQAQWLSEGKKLVPISVNVSRAHFSRYDLAEHICGIVDDFKVPHEFIELELTESAFFDDKQVLLGTVKKLKDFGFKVSMDDFGAGYSSLNSLKELPLDIIKLDAQFFREIDDQKRAELIVSDTIKLAKKLGMQIVAEGIETREQVDFLADQHCDLIQGFYFAKPLPIEEFVERAYAEPKSEGKKA